MESNKISQILYRSLNFSFRINFSEINFLVVSDRGDRYLSDAFGPVEKYCS